MFGFLGPNGAGKTTTAGWTIGALLDKLEELEDVEDNADTTTAYLPAIARSASSQSSTMSM